MSNRIEAAQALGIRSRCLHTYSFLLSCILSLAQQEVCVTRGEMACNDLLVTSRLMKLMSYGAERLFLLTLKRTDAVCAESSSLTILHCAKGLGGAPSPSSHLPEALVWI